MNGITVRQLLDNYHVTNETIIWLLTEKGPVQHIGHGWYVALREYMDREVLFFACPTGKRIEIYLK